MLLLTTESSPERKQQGKQAGATGWMVKPFNPDQLLATLSRVLGSAADGARLRDPARRMQQPNQDGGADSATANQYLTFQLAGQNTA